MTTDEAIQRVVEAVDDLIHAGLMHAKSRAPNRDTLRTALKELLAAHDEEHCNVRITAASI